jgi:hypothetical protein
VFTGRRGRPRVDGYPNTRACSGPALPQTGNVLGEELRRRM